MKAVTFQDIRSVRSDEVAEPRLIDPRDAIVRVRLAAICGSDMHVYHGRETGLDRGTILGHEFVGEVLEVGADAGVPIGARVASPFTTCCGACHFCRIELPARCEHGALFGWVQDGRGLHGAQAELVRVPLADATLVPVPEGVSDAAALLCGDVLATGFFCADNGDVADRVVAVVGCGPVGLMAVIGARERGAREVFAIDSVESRLELAAGYGARPLPLGDAPGDRIRAATEGRGADSVLEAVGSDDAIRFAFSLLRAGGTLSSVGVHTSGAFPITPVEAYDRNLTLRIGRCPARRYTEDLLRLAASGRYDLDAVFSHRLPLGDAAAAYDLFDRRADGCRKVALTTDAG